MNGIKVCGEMGCPGGLTRFRATSGFPSRGLRVSLTALHLSFTTIRGILFCVALSFWILYFHETFFRSGKVRMHWLKRGIADFLLMLSIAIVTFLVLL